MMITPIIQSGSIQPGSIQPGSIQPDSVQPERWGLSLEAVKQLGDTLYDFWARYREHFKTPTRDSSEYAYAYLSAQ